MRRVRSLRSEEKRKNNRRWRRRRRRRMRQVHLVSTLCVAATTASIPTNTDLQSHIPISAPRYTCNHDYLHSSQLCICAPHPPSSMNPGGSGGLSLSSNAGNHHNVQHVIPPAQSRPVQGFGVVEPSKGQPLPHLDRASISRRRATPCDPIFETTPVPPSRRSRCSIPFVPRPVSPPFFFFFFFFIKSGLGTATSTRNASSSSVLLFAWFSGVAAAAP
ncbi:hypothetical protein CTAM01_00562 [Colletotrichum tamarilloi]|uniref:Uncharacterized protein n=1 Tax=Colletotrichum tamarilloi TaxID=1209934 RepID=A0ABQ9RW71_9PEZI|nr:uncharacterized protein CTAM01_00562 [Colletotrichum tamarilloi]KAK1513166.1 hypothetical protein CTAM01_00562 [Colletotrichum tamarilloi]